MMTPARARTVLAACLATVLTLTSVPVQAEVYIGGDSGEVTPVDYTTWDSETDVCIGVSAGQFGEVTVDGDSDVASRIVYIGNGEDTTGALTVTGSGATWDSVRFYIGNSSGNGAGTLRIADGASVTSANVCDLYNSTVAVTGSDSTWTLNYRLNISKGSSMAITNGGSVNSAEAYIASASGDVDVTVAGSGSSWNNYGPLDFGTKGNAALTISDGASASSTSFCYCGGMNTADGTSTFTVTGGDSTLTLGPTLLGGTFGTGTMYISDGGEVICSGLCIDPSMSEYRETNDCFDSAIYLSDGGMLSLAGEVKSIGDFLDLLGSPLAGYPYTLWYTTASTEAVYLLDNTGSHVLAGEASADLYTLTTANGYTTLTSTVVPEPSCMWLLATGAVAFAVWVKRRRAQ